MAYVGNEPTSNFASVTKDLFSGDGSTVAFTLSKAATTNGVAVFVENVRQEPTIAYAVSGTTLTFTAAPVTSSGNNIYVLHHNAVASTANHPAAQDLTAVKGTFTGDLIVDTSVLKVDSTNNAVGINNIIPNSFEAGGSGAEGITIYSQNNNYGNIYFADGTSSSGEKARGYLVYNHSNDSLQLGTAETMRLKIDADGIITKPAQPAFLTTANAHTNFSKDGNNTVDFGTAADNSTEIFDLNADFTPSANSFTAPVAGKYQFNVVVQFNDAVADATYYEVKLIASNRDVRIGIFDPRAFDTTQAYHVESGSVLVDMDASDTVTIRYRQEGGTNTTTDIDATSHFSGFLVA